MYTQEDIKKVQNRLLEMAVVIRDILEANNIPYFITYGTLLGAIRHKGFIPWDDDFDFYLFDDSYDQALKCLRKNLPEDLFLEFFDSEPKYFHGWAHVKDLNSYTVCDLFPQDGEYEHHGISIDLYKMLSATEFTQKRVLIQEHIAYLDRRFSKGLIDKDVYKTRKESLEKSLLKEDNIIASLSDIGKPAYAMPGPYNDSMLKKDIFPLRKTEFENTYFSIPNKAELLLEQCYGNYMQLPPVEKRHPHYSKVKFS